jgi:predicted dehydrogenase
MALKPMTMGIVGLGMWGENQMKSVISKSPHLTVKSCCHYKPEKARDFAGRWKLQAAATYEEMLADPDIEGVFIFTPNFRHCEETLAAAEARKHVYLTKPIADTVAEAKAMAAACTRASVLCYVDHGASTATTTFRMKWVMDQGTIGDVILAEAQESSGWGLRLTGSEWRAHARTCPGGALIQVGCYNTAAFHLLFGEARRVTAFTRKDYTPHDIDDAAMLLIEYANGTIASVASSYVVAVNTSYYRLYGSKGNLFLGPGYQEKEMHLITADTWQYRVPEVPAEVRGPDKHEEFLRCARTGEEPVNNAELATQAVAVVNAALRSARERRPVELAEVLEG